MCKTKEEMLSHLGLPGDKYSFAFIVNIMLGLTDLCTMKINVHYSIKQSVYCPLLCESGTESTPQWEEWVGFHWGQWGHFNDSLLEDPNQALIKKQNSMEPCWLAVTCTLSWHIMSLNVKDNVFFFVCFFSSFVFSVHHIESPNRPLMDIFHNYD